MSELLTFQRGFAARLQAAENSPTPMLVYSNTTLLGAIDALRDNFPVSCDIVGERVFDVLVRSFAKRHPPENPVLALYGRRFPEWLSGQELAEELPYLADVARCERMWIEAMHAADAAVLDLCDLPKGEPELLLELRPRIHPATRFAWQSTPAIEIWKAHQDGFEGELTPAWRPIGALFTRPDQHVRAHAIDAACHRLLFGIRLGENLGEAADAAARLYPQTDIGNCFARLVQAGAFAALPKERTTP